MRIEKRYFEVEVPQPDTLGEAQDIIERYARKLASTTDALRDALDYEKKAHENLKSTQARCTELLEENRLIRARYKEVVG